MRIVFFGTPQFALASLDELSQTEHDIAGVVTRPDRPLGRSRSVLHPPPVKLAATGLGYPVLQPERPTGDLFLASLRRLRADLGVVVAYGHILRPEVLAVPSLGMINLHASLLPRWRGAAPIQRAILAGDPSSGVTIMQMDAGMDTGAILLRGATPIAEDDTSGSLGERLSSVGAKMLVTAVEAIAAGRAHPTPQEDEGATAAPKLTREEARIKWDADAAQVSRHLRAFDPAPGAWTMLDDVAVKLYGAGQTLDRAGPPGTVLEAGETLLVATGAGAIEIAEVHPTGRRRIPAGEWVRGRGIAAGARFT